MNILLQKKDNMNTYLNAISFHLPEDIITNKQISNQHPKWTIEKIGSKTGINQRHIVSENETAADLAYHAAEKLFERYCIEKSVIDYVIFCTQSPDYFLPTTACILQDRLNLSKTCGAIDFNQGCSGFIYGLGLAKGLIVSNQATGVLLLTGETYSKYLNFNDKGNKTLFGDAGAATLISAKQIGSAFDYEILDFCYGTDGSGYENLIVRNGASKHKQKDGIDIFDEEMNFIKNDNNLYMDGRAIFNFTAFKVPFLVMETIKKNQLSFEAIDRFVFHQANEFMMQTVRKRCGIDEQKFYINIKDVGNTVSNTIPIALSKAQSERVLCNDRYLLIAGFGVGLSMGATILKKT